MRHALYNNSVQSCQRTWNFLLFLRDFASLTGHSGLKKAGGFKKNLMFVEWMRKRRSLRRYPLCFKNSVAPRRSWALHLCKAVRSALNGVKVAFSFHTRSGILATLESVDWLVYREDSRSSESCFWSECYSWFSLTWWDAHVGVQNNKQNVAQVLHNNSIIFQKDFLAIVFLVKSN